MEIKRTISDADTNQKYRKINDFIRQYKEDGKSIMMIDVRHYTIGQIESCIQSYGYTLLEDGNGLKNIQKLYGKDYLQIIAECIYEQELLSD